MINLLVVNFGKKKIVIENKNSILYVAKNQTLIALIGVKDNIKDNIKQVIEEIKNKDIEIVMLTGDNEITAKAIAEKIGIKNVIANVNPKEKAQKIKELMKNRQVLMCGDGINDSISLVTANIGVSISNGTDIAIDSSQIILMNDDLNKINQLIEISYRTIKNIKQNLFWAFFYNIAMIPIAMGIFSFAGIVLNPMIASLSMVLSSITVTANVLRLK